MMIDQCNRALSSLSSPRKSEFGRMIHRSEWAFSLVPTLQTLSVETLELDHSGFVSALSLWLQALQELQGLDTPGRGPICY